MSTSFCSAIVQLANQQNKTLIRLIASNQLFLEGKPAMAQVKTVRIWTLNQATKLVDENPSIKQKIEDIFHKHGGIICKWGERDNQKPDPTHQLMYEPGKDASDSS